MLIEERQRSMFASHHQFYIQDGEEPGDTGDSSFWTEKASQIRLALITGTMGIGTRSYADVRVTMEYHTGSPPLDASMWDHATEADLMIGSGFVHICGCLDEENTEIFELTPGNYRFRCCHANLDRESGTPWSGDDWYLVQFWPAEPAGITVLKQWSSVHVSDLKPSIHELEPRSCS